MSTYYQADYKLGQNESPLDFNARYWGGMGEYPPVAFYFSVKFPGLASGAGSVPDASFQEVSGIGVELELEDTPEGGENAFVHHLPKLPKYQKLVLKRGVVPKGSKLVDWCNAVVTGQFPITTGSVEVTLLNMNGEAIRTWSFSDAYPVKWQVEAFNSTKNEVAIETIELCYSRFTRDL